jgi:hypothetical protein
MLTYAARASQASTRLSSHTDIAVLDMGRHSKGNDQETEECEGGKQSGGRHRKYDPVAKAPWHGGDVKPTSLVESHFRS